jgi:hypothetical protein
MNSKSVIYIILSAILLYLYYRNRDLTIFVAFIVLVFATLVFGDAREGLEGKGKGKGKSGGGGGGDCKSLGFTVPKIDKKDKKGSLDKITKNIKKVADKYWEFDDIMGNKPKNDTAKASWKFFQDSETLKSEGDKLNKDKVKSEAVMSFIGSSVGIYEVFVSKPSEEKQDDMIDKLKKNDISKAIKGGEIYLELLNNGKKSDEMKDADKDAKKLMNYLVCLCKQWLSVWKKLQEAEGEGGDGE